MYLCGVMGRDEGVRVARATHTATAAPALILARGNQHTLKDYSLGERAPPLLRPHEEHVPGLEVPWAEAGMVVPE